ncbi:MAG: peptidoglycan DD-metalloendopeptidase family protein [Betaproteobacteria bacterium]
MQRLRILTQRAGAAALRVARHAVTPWQALAIVVLGLSGVAAFGLAPDTVLETVPTRLVQRALALPELAALPSSQRIYWREERVRRGDTIGSLLARANVDDAPALTYMRTDSAARPLYQLRPGRPVRVAIDDDGRLLALRFVTGSGELLALARDGDTFTAASAPPPVETRVTLRAGEIRSSLFGAADDIGLPDAVTLALAEIFAGDIDFYHDLRRGDAFSVLYETRYVDGEAVGTGRVLAAQFVNRGTTFHAYLWRVPDGTEGYYASDGKSTRRAFLRSPVEFSRITSGFTQARFHPILQTWRAHRGTDFAAPTGTPIHATADGVVTQTGREGGYGNVVMLKHGGTYATVYAHLSRFAQGLRVGAHIRQGETVGYVGQTGWATGPHLHYEFRIAGDARNPMTVALPTAFPVAPEQRAAFDAAIAPLLHELAVAQAMPGGRVAASN